MCVVRDDGVVGLITDVLSQNGLHCRNGGREAKTSSSSSSYNSNLPTNQEVQVQWRVRDAWP